MLIYLAVHILYYASILNKQERFMLSYLPILAICAAVGVVESCRRFPAWKSVILAAVWISGLFVVTVDARYYAWNESSPAYWKYVSSLNALVHTNTGMSYANTPIAAANPLVILTADPVPAAYTDAYFEPFYENIDTGAALFDRHINASNAVFFARESFWCSNNNPTCEQKKDMLAAKVAVAGKEVFSVMHDGKTCWLYVARS